MRTRLQRWTERLPDGVTSLVFRAGDDRRSESIVERWTLPIEEVDEVFDVIEDTMTEEHTGRLIAYDGKAKQLRSISVRGVDPQRASESEVGMLVEGLIRMSEEQRRFLATITDSFQTMHDTIQDAIFTERQHHEDMADAQLAIALAEHDATKNTQSTTDKALGLIADVVSQKTAGAPLDIREYVLTNPEIIDSLLDDETIVEMVLKKATGQK